MQILPKKLPKYLFEMCVYMCVKNYQKFETNYKGYNKTLIRLSLIAKFFNDCYSECLNKKNMTLNIILNYYLGNKISKFIVENKDKK